MRTKTETPHTQDEQKEAERKGETLRAKPLVYVAECDAYELPEFYERREELVPQCNAYLIHKIFGGEYGRMGAGWYGENCANWDDAKAILHKGWPKGVERAAKLAAKLQTALPEPESARRKTRWNDDDGGELDREKLYSSGVETAFRGTTRVRQRAPRVIRIVANWSMNAMYSADQIAWNGAAIVALLDLLERADYSTELSLGFPTRHYLHDNHITMPVVRVKTAGDPLSLNAIAAVAGHAGIFRSFGFAAICSSPRAVNDSLGSCLGVKEAWEIAQKAGVVEAPDAFMEIASSEEQAIDQMVNVFRHLFPEMQGLPNTAAERQARKNFGVFKRAHPTDWKKERAKLVKANGKTWWEAMYGVQTGDDV